jgi:hypothetical protein
MLWIEYFVVKSIGFEKLHSHWNRQKPILWPEFIAFKERLKGNRNPNLNKLGHWCIIYFVIQSERGARCSKITNQP